MFRELFVEKILITAKNVVTGLYQNTISGASPSGSGRHHGTYLAIPFPSRSLGVYTPTQERDSPIAPFPIE